MDSIDSAIDSLRAILVHHRCEFLGRKARFGFRSISAEVRKMYLYYYLNENGERVYTLKKRTDDGKPTVSAHPARFSPADQYSRHRLTIKKRFNLLITQQPEPVY